MKGEPRIPFAVGGAEAKGTGERNASQWSAGAGSRMSKRLRSALTAYMAPHANNEIVIFNDLTGIPDQKTPTPAS